MKYFYKKILLLLVCFLFTGSNVMGGYILKWSTAVDNPQMAFGESSIPQNSDFNADNFVDIFVQNSAYGFTLLDGQTGNVLWTFEDSGWIWLDFGNCDNDSTLEILVAHQVPNSFIFDSTFLDSFPFDSTFFDTFQIGLPFDVITILDAATGAIEYEFEGLFGRPGLIDIDNDFIQEILVIEDPNIISCYMFDVETGINDGGDIVTPNGFQLDQNYPNPFNPSTTIKFDLPYKSYVRIEIFNTLGQKVNTLVDQELSAGVYEIEWDGRNSNNTKVASGIYFYRLSSDDFLGTKKMILLK